MNYSRVVKIVKNELREYPLFSKQIEELELSKLQGVESDINSSIKSKNSISSVTENEAIKNIAIDTKIESILKWKLIIDYVFKVIKSKDEFKYDVLAYKYIAHLTEHDIENKLHIARNSIRKYIDEFIIEISYLAIDEGLIKIEKI